MTETIQLFITCLLDSLYPSTGESVVRVLQRAGVRVEFPPGQTCCGQPAFNAGLRRQAVPMARHTIEVFEKTPGPIVVPSGSCAAMIRIGYLELFAEDPVWLPRAIQMAERTFEFTEFLVDYLGAADLGARWPGKLTYHSSCHLLRELGVDRQPRLLLNAVREAEVVELPNTTDCCGFGGVFSVEYPEISTAMLARKLQNIELSGAPLVVACDAGCITNIQGGLRRLGKPQRVRPHRGYPFSDRFERVTFMPGVFHRQIKNALADAQLQSALDGNAERRQNAFTASFDSLPEGRPLQRQRAHALRAKVIANLDSYLKEFADQAQANGIQTHFASDGSQAVEIIRQIAIDSGAKLIVKSKTMVGEEIQLNQRLEADGLKIVETDLGEYIVQLRGEPPAHIITPAVHLTRAQVAQTFVEELGLPYTTDIPALTAAARRILRETFLDADIGISGVNFGVAETGSIVLVTNEGNGRMCTTLPNIHIALMGIERLVPTLDDLAIVLSLLPRSATGQKLSVYTSLIHSPRRPGESDGPLQRHLILLDNGREALRHTPFAEILYCIRCGACLNACPVFRELGGHAYTGIDGKPTPYPGPIGSVISPGLFGLANFGHLARASSLCGACKDACPIDIDLPELLLRVRAEGAISSPEQHATSSSDHRTHVPLAMRLGLAVFSWAARSPGRFSTSQRLGGIFSRLIPAKEGWMHLPDFTGWGYQRDFPRLSSHPFSTSKLATSLAPKNAEETPPAQLPKRAPVGEPVSAAPIAVAQPAPAKESRDPVSWFSEELIAIGGEVVRCEPEVLPLCILEILHSLDIHAVQAWAETCLPAGLLEDLQAGGIAITHTADPLIRCGLTATSAGIAESGSLVLFARPGQAPTASLLPEVHLAVLYAGDIKERLAQVLQIPDIRQASSTAIITGPSRTADIEMTLTIGVHGPRRLIVFIIG